MNNKKTTLFHMKQGSFSSRTDYLIILAHQSLRTLPQYLLL